MQELAWRIRSVEGPLEARLGRAPSAGELAEALGVSVEELLDARSASEAQYAATLDGPMRSGSDDEGSSRMDRFAVEDAGLAAVEDAYTLEALKRCLTDREREILRLRFEEDLKQSEIADRVGCSQMHVSRLLRGALSRLAIEAGKARASEVALAS
jgi:RNA polymerase sigma-B factor